MNKEKRILTLFKELNQEEQCYVLKQLTQIKSDELNTKISKINTKTAFLSFFLLFTSGLSPFIDNFLYLILKLFGVSIDDLEVYYFIDIYAFIWTIGVILSPILIIVSTYFRPSKILYIFPLFAYLTMLIAAILNFSGFFISGLTQFYAFIILISICSFYLLKRIRQFIKTAILSDSIKIEVIENVLKELNNNKSNEV
ncbi:hypothetical protein SAMN05443634_11033 [Chishuiella changwenlii]|uniref:Transmembrane protein n=1 Tax=Chishuiella changwenlii TaxID=1434701 RepID=A0A1M7B3D8_9FLAO|nr:hypothetical protein [Chishuiella changwenlii]GGE95748.1 hypothetical protein GCM10010984_11560 [Chishuiella changwenlii]SHL49525.1 hypothetical protein SAMN05443634_11033 [Chishuiella changwenlii]